MRISDWSSDVCSSDLAAGSASSARWRESRVQDRRSAAPCRRTGETGSPASSVPPESAVPAPPRLPPKLASDGYSYLRVSSPLFRAFLSFVRRTLTLALDQSAWCATASCICRRSAMSIILPQPIATYFTADRADGEAEIGRAPCRERVCQYV